MMIPGGEELWIHLAAVLLGVFFLILLFKLLNLLIPEVWKLLKYIFPKVLRVVELAFTATVAILDRGIELLRTASGKSASQEVHHHYAPQYQHSETTENFRDSVYVKRQGWQAAGGKFTRSCPDCGEPLAGHWVACPGCASSLVPEPWQPLPN